MAWAVLLVLGGGCAHVTVAPMELHITHDINIRVDQQLEDFFSFEKEMATSRASAGSTGAGAPGTCPR